MHLFSRLLGTALCAAVLGACAEPFYCTPGAATWQVTVLDAQGAPVPDLRWTAVIERTHDTIPATLLAAQSDPANGIYAVFTDAVRDRIDPAGEVVRVEGASGTGWFSAAFTFAVPQADCYANRVSGPDTVTLAPAAFALVNADRVWGGGDILVVSPVLRLVDSLPFLVGGDTAWSHAIAGDTAAVTAPINTGAYVVEVVRGDVAELLGTAAARGYGGAAPGPPLSGIIQLWPRGSADPTFLANGPNQLHLVDAASRTVVRVFDDSIHNPLDGDDHCTRGPGPTYDANIFILCPERSTRVAFDIGTDPPVRVEEVCFTDSGYRLAGLIAPGYWLSVFSWVVAPLKCPGSDSWGPYLNVEETEIIRISPRGDRTLVLGNNHSDGGAPVLDIGGLVYRIDDFAGSGAEMGAGFSSDGTALYAGMWKAALGGTLVLKLDATSGTILAQTTLMGMDYPGDLLVDSQGGWVYVLGVRAGHWTLSVLDAATLATAAVLEPGSDACGPEWPVSLVLGSNQEAVFVVRTDGYWQYIPPG
ncbi:MAG: hypothetical protein OER90_20830, partial [Gemmatimonadota bacterium]|nr:hypothetical protein [Gemmatimonadota bacterium]